MSDKTRFMFLIRPDERQALKRLAQSVDRSEGATLRLLIRNAAQQLSDYPQQQSPTNEPDQQAAPAALSSA